MQVKEEEPPKETEKECSEPGKTWESHVMGPWQVMGRELFKKKAVIFDAKRKSEIK